MGSLHQRVARTALADAYGGLEQVVASLTEADFARASRCTGWTVADVLFHVLLDAQRALVAFGTPARTAPDLDYVNYWRNWMQPANQPFAAAHARFVRISSAAYVDPTILARHWQGTARAVLELANGTPGTDRVSTQDHVLTVSDLLGTLAVEVTVHHLDLLLELPGRALPRPAATELTVRTLDELLGDNVTKPPWNDATWILKATGREPLTLTERKVLGAHAARIPLLG